MGEAETSRTRYAGAVGLKLPGRAGLVVCTPMKDGTLHFFVDNRRLGALRVRDSCSLPRMYEFISSPGDTALFTMLEFSSPYCQIKTAKADRNKMIFTSHPTSSALFECRLYWRRPLRPSGEPSTLYYLQSSGKPHYSTWKTSSSVPRP